MKILFDQNISFRVIKSLHSIYPGSKQVHELGLSNLPDKSIWKFAKENQFAIATFDSDFYDLSTLYGHPPKIIWIRIGNTSTLNLARTFERHFDKIKTFLDDPDCADIGCLEIDR